MKWSDEDLQRVRDLATAGQSAAGIAAAFGVTRNSICGLCHRKSIPLRGEGRKKERPAPRPRQDPPVRPVRAVVTRPPLQRAPKPVAAAPLPQPRPAPLANTSDAATAFLAIRFGQCRRPLWSGPTPPIAEAMFCGAPVRDVDCAWCATCAAVMLRPTEKRRAA